MLRQRVEGSSSPPNREVAVSVVMAVFNGQEYLREAIESVLQQTIRDIEFIIVDDGSTDNTCAILREYRERDSRINLLFNGKNQGLARSLNLAIGVAGGKYIARMDADDVSLPHRLEMQVGFLDASPDHVMCGSNAYLIDEMGREVGHTDLFTDDVDLRELALISNPFIHPSVVLRRDILDKFGVNYSENFDTTQDWDFWIKCLAVGKVANLPEILIMQRHHSKSISTRRRGRQLENSLLVQEKYFKVIFPGERWDKEIFSLMNVYLFGDRSLSAENGVNRPRFCLRILCFFNHISKNSSRGAGRGRSLKYLIRRSIVMGLFPPFEAGWWKLFFYLLKKWPFQMLAEAWGYLISRGISKTPILQRSSRTIREIFYN